MTLFAAPPDPAETPDPPGTPDPAGRPADVADPEPVEHAPVKPAPVLGRRRGAAWLRVGQGVHRPRDPALDDTGPAVADDPSEAARRRRERLDLDVRAWQLAIPETACFTHLTGAVLRRWWLPPLPDDLPVFVAQGLSPHATQRPELRVTRHPHPPRSEDVEGHRVAGVGETLLACARDLGLLDVVVLVDCVMHSDHATPEALRAVAGCRRRGAPVLRAALALADGRSESAWETLLRILHVTVGIAVEPQRTVVDEHGAFVARGDLWLVGTRMLHEYDGGDHLGRPRQRKDLRRSRFLGHSDWERRGYTSEEVLHQAVQVLRDADASLGREHDPARIRAWHDLLRESLFTPAGSERFRRRVRLPPPSSAGRTAER